MFLNVCAAKRQSQPQKSADLRFFTSSKLSLPMSFLPLPTVSVSTSLFFIYVLIFAPQIHNTSIAKLERRKKKEKEMEILGGLVGKLGRHCYSVLCLGVLLVSVTIAHYVRASEPSDPRQRTIRRLCALHGPPS